MPGGAGGRPLPGRARAYALGVALLVLLRGQPGFGWRDEGSALDRLVGSRVFGPASRRGRTAGEILAADDADLTTFRRQRTKALLYP